MCFICRILNGAEPLTPEQGNALKPVAVAVFNASSEVVKLDPDAILALSQIASIRKSPDALEIARVLNSFSEFRERCRDYGRKYGLAGGHISRAQANQAPDSPPLDAAGLDPNERAEVLATRAEVEEIAARILKLNPEKLRRLQNCQRSTRTIAIIHALANTKAFILAAIK